MASVKESGLYFVGPLGIGQGEDIVFDESAVWMQAILEELEEGVDPEDTAALAATPSFIDFRGDIFKRNNTLYGDYITLEGTLKGAFNTYCVVSGERMKDTVEVEVQAVFLAKHLCEELELADEITLFIDEAEYELFYYEKRHVDLKETLHEYLFLNKNYYPKKEGAQAPI